MRFHVPRKLLLVVAGSLESVARAVRRSAEHDAALNASAAQQLSPGEVTSSTRSSGPQRTGWPCVRAGAPWLLDAPEQVAQPPVAAPAQQRPPSESLRPYNSVGRRKPHHSRRLT